VASAESLEVPFSVCIQGGNNPVRVALFCLRFLVSGSIVIDEESFARVAEAVGGVNVDGLIVAGFEDLQRLCDLGHFAIYVTEGGLVKAKLC